VDEVVLALPGVEELLPAPYWEHSDLHGTDSLMRSMHAGPAPALRGVRMFLQRSERRIHGVWLLGANVCSHPGTYVAPFVQRGFDSARRWAPTHTRVTGLSELGARGWVTPAETPRDHLAGALVEAGELQPRPPQPPTTTLA
jgi:hypothetical protein